MYLRPKNIRVLVVEPANQHPPYERARPNGSLGPAYIVGALRKNGIEADYLDATVGLPGTNLDKTFFLRTEMQNGNVRCGMSADEMAEIFCAYDIIATSSIFTVQTRMHFEVAAVANRVQKEHGKPQLVVSGGVNARALKDHFLANGFDVVALGEGERTIVQIVEQLTSGQPDYSKVERVAFRLDGRTVVTSAPPRKNLKFIDDVPSPALDALPLETYEELGIPHAGFPLRGTMFAALQTSRGCQDACTFCHISLEKRDRDELGNIGFLRMFSNERVADDVSRAYSLGVRRLYFEDDNLFFNKKRLIELAPLIKRKDLSYSDVNGANLRFLVRKTNTGYEPDTEFIGALAELGLDELSLPFETRNEEMMKKYATGKYDPEEMNPIGILKAVKAAGIRPTSNFLIGFRDESWESVLRTKEFAKELFAEGLDSAGFAIPVPYPGTLDFEFQMTNEKIRKDFNENLLRYTDQMHIRGRPLFPTEIPGEKLQAAVREFWEELNALTYVNAVNSMRASGNQPVQAKH